VSCGICVLIMIEPMATKGVEALYRLNRQCEEQRADGPLPEGATGVPRGGGGQWTTRHTSTKRIGFAFRPGNRQETAEFGLVRDRDSEAVMHLHEMAS